MKIKVLPSQERLHQILSYDPNTGVFRWKRRPNCPHLHGLIGTVAGSQREKGIAIYVDGVPYYAHRLAWVYGYGDVLDTETQIDHRDLDSHNNRLKNLRPATHGQNCSNSRRRRNRRHDLPKGVHHYNNSGRFKAVIGIDKKIITIGVFDTPELAHAAYIKAAVVAKGEFARAT